MKRVYQNFVFFLCLVSISFSRIHADIQDILNCYEELRVVSHRTNGAQVPVAEAVKKLQKEHPEAFRVQAWSITDDQVAQVGILDMALISLKCREILLTAFLAQEGHSVIASDIPEFEEYEQEKILIDLLRRQGIEQHLTDGEIVHYAEIVLILWFSIGERVS